MPHKQLMCKQLRGVVLTNIPSFLLLKYAFDNYVNGFK